MENILENNAFRGVVIVNEQKEDNYDDEINTVLVQVMITRAGK